MNESRIFPGSRWWKFDFHTHSPKSMDYGRGNNAYKSIPPELWLQKAMLAGLDCIALTDHNSGGWIDVIKTKYSELKNLENKPDWFRELVIFPGVEISVGGNQARVHMLAIFDPTCDSQKITGVLGSCGITSGFGDGDQTSTLTSFIETVMKIHEAGGIAIAAHIDGKKGLLEGVTTLSPEIKNNLQKVNAAEFCDLNAFIDAKPILKEQIGQLAKLAGSDSHKPEDLGKHFSWLKMSCPSIEGLRLAIMDFEFCVKNQIEEPDCQPDIFLTELSIESMSHCGRLPGQPFIIKFHPHFNAIIGGRGSGKSTVLESIRIASRRNQNLASESPRVNDELARFLLHSNKSGVMLDNTEILLNIHRRKVLYQLRWRFDGQGSVLRELIDHGWQDVEAGDLLARFPISIYSQKQINELASNPRGLLQIIDRSEAVRYAEWKTRWDSLKSQYLQLCEQQRDLLRHLSGEEQIRIKLRDVENDLKQYEEKGHGEILKNYQIRSQQKNSLPSDQVFVELAAGIRALSQNAGLSDFPVHLFGDTDRATNELRFIHEQTNLELQQVRSSLDAIADAVDQLMTERNHQIESSLWYRSVQDSIQAYDELIKAYEEKKSQISIALYGDWVRQRNQLNQQLGQLKSLRIELAHSQGQKEKIEQSFHDMRKELFEKRGAFIQKIIGDNAYVRMELVQYGDVSTIEDEYRKMLNLDETKFQSSILENENKRSILWDLANWEEMNIPISEIPNLVVAVKQRTMDIATGKQNGNHGAFDNRLTKLYQTQPAVFDQLLAWWPDDLLLVKYSKEPRSPKFENLEKGSAGQKAAAILAFILSQGSEPLIIDQPEDDLDNALIYDLIVSQIHENKSRRQLIIVTHNPNIVVNGDAELVHILKYENGQVHMVRQGGLEEALVRGDICTIMEGGRRAFEKRYRRITMEDDRHV